MSARLSERSGARKNLLSWLNHEGSFRKKHQNEKGRRMGKWGGEKVISIPKKSTVWGAQSLPPFIGGLGPPPRRRVEDESER